MNTLIFSDAKANLLKVKKTDIKDLYFEFEEHAKETGLSEKEFPEFVLKELQKSAEKAFKSLCYLEHRINRGRYE